MEHVTAKLDISERRACRVLGQPRSTQRQAPKMADAEAALTAAIAIAYAACTAVTLSAMIEGTSVRHFRA